MSVTDDDDDDLDEPSSDEDSDSNGEELDESFEDYSPEQDWDLQPGAWPSRGAVKL
jgi:hypothetical protein